MLCPIRLSSNWGWEGCVCAKLVFVALCLQSTHIQILLVRDNIIQGHCHLLCSIRLSSKWGWGELELRVRLYSWLVAFKLHTPRYTLLASDNLVRGHCHLL